MPNLHNRYKLAERKKILGKKNGVYVKLLIAM
jgi:hypothetical protein